MRGRRVWLAALAALALPVAAQDTAGAASVPATASAGSAVSPVPH